MSVAPNTTLAHYRIVSKLGEGGMGEVWLAEDTRLGRKVALKLLPTEFTEDSDRVRRFTLEAKAASALNHPNIIAVHDIGECENGRFIVMEFVAGSTLRTIIARDNSLETLFTLGGQMAKALSAAHAAGITHRDIKPDNIMVRDDGYVKMLDFGLARLLPTTSSDPEAMTLAQQTTPGTVMGTYAYMSPEQASGQTVGTESDVFALGIVLYELATGSHPFRSETTIGYLHAITSQTPVSMTSLKSHLPVALDDLILRMLEKDPNIRPTASEVAQALLDIERYGSSNTLPLRIETEKPKTSLTDEGFWVAVLPFKFTGSNTEVVSLAEGLAEEIVTGLSRFSYLRVISRSSTLRNFSETDDVRAIAKQIGARYVMEGSLRLAGSLVRITVQLVDASTGAHLWAESFDRSFQPENIFELQDEVAARIVSTIADMHGVLPRSLCESVRNRPPDRLTPYEAVLRGFGYYERLTKEELAAAQTAVELAVEKEPSYVDAWAMLALLRVHGYAMGFNAEADSLTSGFVAARRAVDAASTNHLAYFSLAQALFFQKEFDGFRNAAERTITLNPMDGNSLALLGEMIAYAGDWERGLELAERAKRLNPHHPVWYWHVNFNNAYRQRDYRGALGFAQKMNLTNNWGAHGLMLAACGQLGESDAGDRSLRELLRLRPDAAIALLAAGEKWFDREHREHLIEGWRKAGLDFPQGPNHSSVSRADEGFWVAVLPFKFTGSNSEVATLAEGLSEEIVTGLSRFSYLRVISRSSTLRYASETSDVRTIGNAIGARYVLEGSLRSAGSSLRVSVQLVDSTTGAHLWVETYKRSISIDDVFELQDDLASRIVSTIADMNGVLPHTMGELLRQRDSTTLTPYESVLRAFAFVERLTAEEHKIVSTALERAVEEAPEHSDCLAMLAMMYVGEHVHGFNAQPNPLERGLAVAQRAVAAGPSNHVAHAALAQTLFFRRDLQGFRSAANRALALNPMDAYTTAFMGILIAYAGDWERGTALAEKGMELNPNHPGWYRFCSFFKEYGQGDYQAALDIALRINMPSYYFTPAAVAMAYAKLGESTKAQAALRELLAQVPDFGAVARQAYEKWLGSGELLEDVLDGLRKAGLKTG